MFVEFTDNVVKLDRLADVMQAGTVIGFDMKGTLEEGRISYQLRAEVMVPFVNSDPRDRGALISPTSTSAASSASSSSSGLH